MRIIFLLAAAMGAAAIGGPAEAQSGAGFARQGGPAGSWATGGGHRAGPGRVFVVRPGRGHDRHDRFGRRGRHPFYPYGGFGIAGPVESAGPYGSGYFADGGRVRLRDGQPYYDYDRAYPYEWPSAAAGGDEEWEEEEAGPAPSRCTFENGVRVCRGGSRPGAGSALAVR